MVGTFFVQHLIERRRPELLLRHLLQHALVIAAQPRLDFQIELGSHRPLHERANGLVSAVQINGRHDRLEHARQNRRRNLVMRQQPLAQDQEILQADLLGDAGNVLRLTSDDLIRVSSPSGYSGKRR